MRTVHHDRHHLCWDRRLAPALVVAPGDTVELSCLDASGGRIRPDSTHADLRALDPAAANPVTGPIAIDGAAPGDALAVQMLDFELSGWGWTAIIPGFGLLSEDFAEPRLHLCSYDAERIAFTPEIHVPTRPFPGTIGVPPAAGAPLALIPPHRGGGNIDCRDLVRGATIHLPVAVPGALLSIGDTHAAQGDGEVCGTAIETPLRVRIRVDLIKGHRLAAPQIDVPAASAPDPRAGGYHLTTAVEPDLMHAARSAVRAMIEHLDRRYGLAPELAYMLCSVAGDLVIKEIVNTPNWVVGFRMPHALF